MSADKPFIDQMTDMAKDARASIPEVPVMKDATSGADSAMQSIAEMKEGVGKSLGDFSNKSVVDASSEFLDSNSLLAKLSCIILVLIAFMVILKFMMSLVGYFMSASSNPYIIYGKMSGSDTATITQEPGLPTTIEISRSNDRMSGMEYTWSTWLYLNEKIVTTSGSGPAQNIFVKGGFDLSGGDKFAITNGPGMYVQTSTDSSGSHCNLLVVVDIIGGDAVVPNSTTSGRETIKIEYVPIKKWVHVAVRLSNMIMDVYVNGTIAKRHNMTKLPKQNSSNIIVCGNSGFSGSLSNLRYYSYALNVFEINNIVMGGPNLSASSLSTDSIAASGNYSYLSNQWYSSGY